MKRTFLFCIALAAMVCASAQKIKQYTYWFDDALNKSVTTAIGPSSTAKLTASIKTDSLGAGLHRFNIQFADDSARYSSVVSQYFYKVSGVNADTSVKAYEYWYDDDYAHKVSASVTATVLLNLNLNTDVSLLTTGLHRFNIRFKSSTIWSSAVSQYFYKTSSASKDTSIKACEYWYDDDYIHKTSKTVTAASLLNLSLSADASSLFAGLHRFNIRFKSDSLWSAPLSQYFYKTAASKDTAVKTYEYWYDDDYAHKIKGAVAGTSVLSFGTGADASALVPGTHRFNIRFGGDSIWSSTVTRFFYKTLQASLITGYRYWFDNNLATTAVNMPVPVPAPIVNIAGKLRTLDLDTGTHYIYIQTRDSSGLWSSSAGYKIKVVTALVIDSVQTSATVICPASKFVVAAQPYGTFKTGNIFTAQLSDTAGKFNNPVTIGTLAAKPVGRKQSISIDAFMPANTANSNKYRIRIISSNPALISDSTPYSITVQKPKLAADTAIQICSGNFVNITAVYNTAGLTAKWKILRPDSITTPGADTLIVTNTFGCMDTAVVSIIANPKPNLDADATITICAGSVTSIKAIYNLTGLVAQWSIANPDSVGLGVYTLIVTNAYGCRDTAFITVANYPKPNLGNDTTLYTCAATAINIKNLYNTTGLTAVWNTARPDSITVAGTYTLIVTSANGCKDTAVVTVANYPKPNLGKDTVVYTCPGTAVSIINLYSTSGLTTSWSVTRPDSVGAGIYTLIVTNSNGCKDTAIITVSNYAKPNLGKDTTVSSCPGAVLNLKNVYKTAGLTSSWSVARPDSVVKTGKYSLIVTNTTGCKDTAVITVTNYSKPNIGKDTALLICAGSTGSIKNLYNITGLTAVFSAPKPDSVGKGIYTLMVTNANGCKDTAVITVDTLQAPVMPVIAVTGATGICLGDSTTLAATNYPGAPTVIQWLKNDTTVAGAVNTSYAAKAGGVYKLKFINQAGCFIVSAGQAVTIIGVKPVVPVISKTGAASFCLNDSLVLTTMAAGPYQWQRNNADIKKATAAKYVVSLAGAFKLRVTDGGSCSTVSDSVIVSITQVPRPTITLLNDTLHSSSPTGNQWFLSGKPVGVTSAGYSPDYLGYYTVQVTIGGCTSPMSDPFLYTANTLVKSRGKVILYPNPAQDAAQLQLSGFKSGVIVTVTDMAGKAVWQQDKLTNKTYTLPLHNLASGVYMVTVRDGKNIRTFKLVKAK